ncbi:Maf family protein [Corynebacterium mendelii]|uniref:Nucleoside triphosphate pyrophosphatase n=1 Tax=Corynebacterium mendelii TaxID=2765362 RepID=A0A939E2I4_9CORY|nr:nucleoside triphosphate pyrophosphatase [Corynebacterium mendelii]MBN9644506.1 septum formation inhibitor Maf [Corynebacterium mendelii]
MRIVLASSSPSRKKLLCDAGVQPVIDPADIDEDAVFSTCSHLPPEQQVAVLAENKARAVAGRHPGDVIIGGDSMLLINGVLQGKPKTVETTIERWKNQRGTTAVLHTGHCIIGPQGQTVTRTSSTTIRFGNVSDADIAAYARSKEPLWCAGAFTLEAIGGWFIDSIEGDPSGVIGLSLPLVRKALYSMGLDVCDFF